MSSTIIGSILSGVGILDALKNINPKFKSFILGASAAGYSTEKILDFLRSEYTNQNESKEDIRPDEEAAINRRGLEERTGKTLKTAAIAGASLAGGLGVSALTAGAGALSKAAPKVAGAAAAAKKAPLNSLSKGAAAVAGSAPQAAAVAPQVAAQAAPQMANMASKLMQNFPQLSKFLDGEIAKGIAPIQAAANARNNKMLNPIVQKIESGINEKFEDLIGRLYANVKPQSNSGGQLYSGGNDAALLSSLQNLLKM